MEPSHRIVPANASKSASIRDTANSLGLHDALRYGPRSLAAENKTRGGLRERLENVCVLPCGRARLLNCVNLHLGLPIISEYDQWDATQDNLKLTMQRNTFGLHMPMRMLMERKIVSRNPHMPALPQSNPHLDILMGRDETLDCADFMMPASELAQPLDVHAEMEKKLRM
ncbi:proteasome maturation factor UMP1 [Fomitopsis serialis]|uniref:proteasome maturation factor UMP1 n=1 Tax=Fomitopsis serialis TaxID=139415 RepID=UPI0020083282|nr:proteasome maturation factor UMP1 [Neoantrodia serialis]KAH9931278.1 proteasome maturation factor UMP1 [Neoantrodia serialis]